MTRTAAVDYARKHQRVGWWTLGPAAGRGLDVAERIALAMAGLPAHYPSVLRAKYESRLSVKEIAARDGVLPKAIESLLARARAAFRDAYRRLDEKP